MSNIPANSRRSLYLLCAALLLHSCSSNPDDKHSTPAVQAPKEVPAEVYTVEIKNMKFVPDSIVVKKGDKVVFVNRDMVTHCVTEDGPHAWTSAAIPSGEAFMHVASQNSNYYCAIHMVMKGKIIAR